MPKTSIDRIARELSDLKRQVRALSTQPRLPFSSIDGGFLTWNDLQGSPRTVVGIQDDGTVTTRDLNGPAPVAPSAPIVSGDTPGLLTVTSYGLTSDGSDWLRDFVGIEVHVSATNGFTPSPATKVAQLQTDGGVINIALPSGDWYVVLVAINTSGVSSAPSTQVTGIVTDPITSSGIDVYYTAVEPTGTIVTGSIWYDTGNGNHSYYWDGSNWLDSQDGSIVDAADAAQSADDAATAAAAAAASKAASFVQETTPTASGVGDTWRIPSEGNALYVWDGTNWQYAPLGAGALDTDVLAGKQVPVGEAVTLAWGVPDPSHSLSGATMVTLPEPWQAHAVDGLPRHGLTNDGTDYAYVKELSSTSMQITKISASTGAETAVGSPFTIGGASSAEQLIGITKIGSSYYVLIDHFSASNAHWLWKMRVFNSSGVQQSNLTLNDFGVTPPDWANTNVGFSNDGTNVIVGWFDDTTNKLAIQKYTTAGATSGGQVNSTTTVAGAGYVAGLGYGSFDLGATRFLLSCSNGTTYSMNTSGVLQSTEAFAGTWWGLAYDSASSRIVTVTTLGLSRFTTATSDAARWAAYSWADRNATGGTHETALSPTISVTVPKRMLVQFTNFPTAPGAAGTGTDAPSTTRLYLSASNGAASTFHLQQDSTYPDALLRGSSDLSSSTTAISTSTFVSGASGSIQSESGGFQVNGDGTGTWPALELRQVPAGSIMMWAGATASPPTGYLVCDGSSLSTTTYATLFAAIGYTFGGSGSSFNLPNFQNRKPLGAYSSKLLGTTGGAETHTVSTAELPSITVRYRTNSPPATGSIKAVSDVGGVSGATGDSTGTFGSGTAMSIQDPYLAINFIIRTGN